MVDFRRKPHLILSLDNEWTNFSTANGRWLLVVRKQNEMEFKLPPMTNDVMQFKQGNGFYLVDNTSSYSYHE